TENSSIIRGKIEISDSLQNKTILKKQMMCTHDDFSTNTYMNKIIKTTLIKLLRLNVAPKRKKEIRKLLLYLTNVELLNYHEINWQLNFNRNNQTYRMLIGICYLILNGLLQTQNDGTLKLMDFIDDQKMHRLYEKFILEYYRKEFPDVSVNASQIDWQLDTNEQSFLPIMQSDILLSYKKRILIIDAKYYTHILNSRFENETVQSANLYQIFTYVKNKQI